MISLHAIGRPNAPASFGWTEADTMLYALGVGAGQTGDPNELRFTTDNSAGVHLVAIPSMIVAMVQRYAPKPDYGEVQLADVIHGEQELIVHKRIPVAGRAEVATTIEGIYDQGKAAVALVVGQVRSVDDNELIAETRLTAFIRNEGGFGGQRFVSRGAPLPDSPPDLRLPLTTRPEQALVYRLSGDRNPLHSDPVFATDAGFDRPILHGLCTYGAALRRMLVDLPDMDLDNFHSMFARFSKPVFPGDALVVEVWTGADVRFRVINDAGEVVLDRGCLT